MKTTLPILTLALAAVLCAPSALAGNSFVGASYGQSDVEVELGATFKDDDSAWKLYGGWNFMQYFGVEIGYVDFGNWTDTQGPLIFAGDNQSLYASGVGQFTIAKVVTIFGKVGIHSYNENLVVTNPNNNFSVFSDKSGPGGTYGVGIGFNVKRLQIRAEYEYFKTDAAEETTLTSIGVRWTFGDPE